MNYLTFWVSCNISLAIISHFLLNSDVEKKAECFILLNAILFFWFVSIIVYDVFKAIFKRIFKKKKNTNYEKCWEKMSEIGCAGTIGMCAKDEYSINSSDSDSPYYTCFCPISTDSPDEDFELKKKIERKKRDYRFKW